MTDKISKLLSKLSKQDLIRIQDVISKIILSDYEGLDIKALKEHKDIFRVRTGNYRVIFRVVDKNNTEVIAIAKRNERTYKDF